MCGRAEVLWEKKVAVVGMAIWMPGDIYALWIYAESQLQKQFGSCYTVASAKARNQSHSFYSGLEKPRTRRLERTCVTGEDETTYPADSSWANSSEAWE